MEGTVYAVEDRIEERHWWFVGRRKLMSGLISGLKIPAKTRILDIGPSTGSNLRLAYGLGYKDIFAIDLSSEAVNFCREKFKGNLGRADICNMPFKEGQFGLVFATDIIEHVDDDITALSEIKRVLCQGGYAIITVPAFKFLWGLQDNLSQHKRRYNKSEFLKKIRESGLSCAECFYFNYLLLPFIWLGRRLIGLLKIRLKSENEVNAPLVNFLLKGIFLLDVGLARRISPPFGVSIMAVAKR